MLSDKHRGMLQLFVSEELSEWPATVEAVAAALAVDDELRRTRQLLRTLTDATAEIHSLEPVGDCPTCVALAAARSGMKNEPG